MFSRAIDSLFSSSAGFSRSATLCRGGQPDLAIRVIAVQPDVALTAGGASVYRHTALFDVRASDAIPAAGDEIVIGDETFTVFGTPMADSERLVWRCEARRE